MVRSLAQLFLLAALQLHSVAATVAVATSSTSTSTTTSETTEAASCGADTQVEVQGQSGRFTVYSAAAGREAGVAVLMDALRELDAEGNAVGTSGNVKHSIQTFAPQDFTISPSEAVMLGSVSATKISFESPISTIGKIRVITYLMNEDGEIGQGNETFTVKCGDMKWNIELYEWTWCGCTQGQTAQVGEFIELDVTVRGAGNASKSSQNDNLIELGSGASLLLSNEVIVDGAVTTMPAVRTALQGSSTVITFKFPKFTTSALYDPVISLSGGSGATATTTAFTSGDQVSVGAASGGANLASAIMLGWLAFLSFVRF
mmetsp:Transcript_19924/g.46358  ORF Transcript_19924/g.46358 Transcript_19924/m.46358 type:complete len:317 (+) Transcript_19924:118-1068(+)